MTPERWQQIKALLEAALERDASERSAFLAAACANNESLRKEVESFIISHDQADRFIEDPAFEVMAESLTANTESLTALTFAHYAIGEQLGAGGMGEVYLAEDTRLGRKVALKLLPASFTTADERVRRFQQEARAASALNHPNILTIYEIGQIESRHFIATEFIEGETLRQWMINDQIKIKDALDIATQVASALDVAHRARIVHRDIKPENVMLRADGIIKVLDFGLAKLVERKASEPEATTLMQTRQGMVMGTPHYMSPEQTRGLKVDERTDIWSLGVLLYEMIAGRVPFAGDTPSDIIVSILDREPPPLVRANTEIPDALQSIVARALSKKLDERYQSASEVLADLKNLKQRLDFQVELERWSGGREIAIASTSPVAAERQLDSVAILPLLNTSGNPELEYLSDGITESMINSLSRLPELRVMAWSIVSSYKGKQVDPREAGLRLNVRAVMTGRVIQSSERLVIRIELVDVTDGSNLWGESFDCKPAEILDIEATIAKELSDKLMLRLTYEEKRQLTKRYTENVEAYHAYLKGRHFWNKRTEESVRQGIEHFKQAIDVDPTYALAFAGLADSYAILGSFGIDALAPNEAFPKARQAAMTALEIDESLAEAHASLGITLAEYYWDWPAAEREFKRSIELKPDYAVAHHWYGFIYLIAMGLVDEAIAEMQKACELDPLSLIIGTNLGLLWYLKREYEQAIRVCRQAMNLDHAFVYGHWHLAMAYEQKGDYQQAISEFQKAIDLSGGSSLTKALLAHAYAVSGEKAKASEILGELVALSTQKHVSPYRLAMIFVGLGDGEHAFEWLERASEQRDPWLIWLRTDPALDDLRADPRFGELLRKMGLTPRETPPPFPSTGAVPKSPRPQKAIKSLAVLALVNRSPDPDMEYLSDGVAESIIDNISQLPGLRVMAWGTVARYKDAELMPSEIGRALGVRAVLSGSLRQVGEHLIVRAELIDVTDGAQLWSDRYERSAADILAVQQEITREISEKLRRRLTGKEKSQIAKRHPVNIDAYHAYLQGRYYWNKRATEWLKKGAAYFRQAIDLDPNYASAYAGLSDSYTLLVVREALPPEEGFAKAKAAAARALQIDETFAQAHASLGHALLHNWEWDAGERELKKAIKLNPGYPSSHHWYSEHLTAMGRCDESIAELKLAGELDPLSLIISADLGRAWYYARQYDQAIKQEARTIEMDRNFWLSHINLGRAYLQIGAHSKAIHELQKASKLSEANTEALSFLGYAYAAAGRKDEALQTLADLNDKSRFRQVPPYHLAIVHAGLGDQEQAFAWLERAFEKHSVDLFTLKVEPMLDALRSDPRFTDLLRRTGLARVETPSRRRSTETVLRSASPRRTLRRGIKSLAILPLVNTSADPNMDYLSDGITESIINNLSQLPNLKVMARSTVFRYKGRDIDPQQVGQELGVRAVLTGRVQQINERLVIGAELVNVADASQLWGEQYHRATADIFALQEEIARQISETLRLKVSEPQKKRLLKRPTKNAQAYELYLKGRFFWNKRSQEDANRGIDCFQQALSLDPDFALAHTGLADCQILLGDVGIQAHPPKESFLQGHASAARALAIDDDVAEAHGTMGHVSMHLFDWPRAERELRRALELNPNYAQAWVWQAYYLAFKGLVPDSIDSINRALQLDPFSLPVNTSRAELLFFAGRLDESIDQSQRALELDERRSLPHLELARVYEHREMYEAAIAEFIRARKLAADSPESLASLAHCYAVSGSIKNAKQLLSELIEMSERRYVSPYDMALIHEGLNQNEQCFDWLNQAYETNDGWMIYITVDPRWGRLREDARFRQVVRRVGLSNIGA